MHGQQAYYPPMDGVYQAPVGAGQGAFVPCGYGGFGAPNMNPGSPFFPMPMMFPPYAGDGSMAAGGDGQPGGMPNGGAAQNGGGGQADGQGNGYDAMMAQHQQQMYMQMMMQMQMQAQQQQQHGGPQNGYQNFGGGGAMYMGGDQGGYQQNFNGYGAPQTATGDDSNAAAAGDEQ